MNINISTMTLYVPYEENIDLRLIFSLIPFDQFEKGRIIEPLQFEKINRYSDKWNYTEKTYFKHVIMTSIQSKYGNYSFKVSSNSIHMVGIKRIEHAIEICYFLKDCINYIYYHLNILSKIDKNKLEQYKTYGLNKVDDCGEGLILLEKQKNGYNDINDYNSELEYVMNKSLDFQNIKVFDYKRKDNNDIYIKFSMVNHIFDSGIKVKDRKKICQLFNNNDFICRINNFSCKDIQIKLPYDNTAENIHKRLTSSSNHSFILRIGGMVTQSSLSPDTIEHAHTKFMNIINKGLKSENYKNAFVKKIYN